MVQRLDRRAPRQDRRRRSTRCLPVLDDVPHRRARTWRGCSRTWSRARSSNQIVVDADTAEWAKVALERMLDIT